MSRADVGADAIYDFWRSDFGDTSPKASGYLSEYSFSRERALVLETVGDAPGVVVDLACGAGLITLPLARTGSPVIGVDFNAAACREAGRNGLAVLRGDVFRLALGNAVVDTVVNVEFAQQYDLAAVEGLLREALRVLRPSGRLVIVWSNRASLVHRVAGRVLRALDRLRGRPTMPLFHHSPADMLAMARSVGLASDELFAIFPPLGLRLNRARGILTSLIGSSFVAVLRPCSSKAQKPASSEST